ncbi:MAG: hypothetical protein AB7F50_00740 [Fimbriimonadaceae bacterium]
MPGNFVSARFDASTGEIHELQAEGAYQLEPYPNQVVSEEEARRSALTVPGAGVVQRLSEPDYRAISGWKRSCTNDGLLYVRAYRVPLVYSVVCEHRFVVVHAGTGKVLESTSLSRDSSEGAEQRATIEEPLTQPAADGIGSPHRSVSKPRPSVPAWRTPGALWGASVVAAFLSARWVRSRRR